MKIKVSTNFPSEPIIRQTPGRLGVWKESKFHINDRAVSDCDVWVVLEGLSRPDRATVKSGVTVLFAMEPPDAKTYSAAFLSQFSLVITSHTHVPHPNTRTEFPGLPWHIGLDRGPRGAHGEDGFRCIFDYDALTQMAPIVKTKRVSTICSITQNLPGQKLRTEFVRYLQQHFEEKIDVFGRGVRPIADKFQALAPYEFHIVLENSVSRDYWTEKLADSFLGYCFPIYWGCPNIDAYFPEESLIKIDISNPAKSLEDISTLVANGLTQRQRLAMLAARRLVLDRFNTFEVVHRICSSVKPERKKTIDLWPEWYFKLSPSARMAKRLKARLEFR